MPGQAVRDLGEGITDGPKKMCFGLCGGGANSGIGPCRNRDWGEELCGGRRGPELHHGRIWVEQLTAEELGESVAYTSVGVGPLGGTAIPCPPSTCEAWGVPCDDCFEPDVMKVEPTAVAVRAEHTCQTPVVPIAATPRANDPNIYPNDAAIWHNSQQPEQSLIFGSDRGRGRNRGHVWAFALSGRIAYTLNVTNPYHVDVEYGLRLGGRARDIVATCERNNQLLRIWAIEADGSLSPADGCETLDGGGCGIPIFVNETSKTCTNVQLYKRPADGAIFAVVARDQTRGRWHRSISAQAGYFEAGAFSPFRLSAGQPIPLRLGLDGAEHELSVRSDMPDVSTAVAELQRALDAVVLMAVIESADIFGTVTFAKTASGAVNVTASLRWTDESWPVNTVGHMWHIHADSLAGEDIRACNCDNDDDIRDCVQSECPQCWVAGGHFDPARVELDEAYSCDPAEQSTCYAGDLSGKFGTLTITALTEPPVPSITGIDTELPFEQLLGKSVVIHQEHESTDRIACGEIVSAAFVSAVDDDDDDETRKHLRITSGTESARSTVEIAPSDSQAERSAALKTALFGSGQSARGRDYVPGYRESIEQIRSFLWQYRLYDGGGGTVAAEKVREFGTRSLHDLAVDDDAPFPSGGRGVVYSVSYDEVTQLPADPAAPAAQREFLFDGQGVFERYREGGSVWVARGDAKIPAVDTGGYVIVGDYSNSSMQAFCRSNPGAPPRVLQAIIRSEDFSGKVTFTSSQSVVEVYASLKYRRGDAAATSGHNWHIHASDAPLDTEDCDSAGPHYDPDGLEAVDGYSCEQPANASSCYRGDLSGKMGPLTIGERGEEYWQRFRPTAPLTGTDGTLELSQLIGKTLVIHAESGGSGRLACARITEGIPDTSTHVGTVAMGGLERSSGHEVSSDDFGPDLDQGIMVAMSDHSHNFLIYNMKDVLACLPADSCGVNRLTTATTAVPGLSAPVVAEPRYILFSDVGGSGSDVNMATTLAIVIAAGALATLKLQQKTKLAMEIKLASGAEEAIVVERISLKGDEGDSEAASWSLSSSAPSSEASPAAAALFIVAGLLLCFAALVRIYNSKLCLVRDIGGSVSCTEGPSALARVGEVLQTPHTFLAPSSNHGEGPGLTGAVGVLLFCCGAALVTRGAGLLEQRRDMLSRCLQRSWAPPCKPLGPETFGILLQNVALVALVLRWFTPELECTMHEGEELCARDWPWLSEGAEFPYLQSWGKQMGAVAGDAMALSLIPIPRNSILLPLLGVPFERALRVHRGLGQVAVIATVAHGASFFVDWGMHPRQTDGWSYIVQQCSPFCDRSTAEAAQLCDESFNEGGVNEDTWLFDTLSEKRLQNFSGVVAGMCFVAILLSSLSWVRRNYWEWFYKTHVVCALLSFVSLYYHFDLGRLDVAAPFLCLMLADYLLRAWRSFRGDATVVQSKVFGGAEGRFLAIEVQTARFRCTEPGQYFFVRVPSLARTQWHPFSVASAPDERTTEIVLKDLGDWTHQLCSEPAKHLPTGARIRLDGPYGRLGVPIASYDAVLMCCGGIGCTPLLSVLSWLIKRAETSVSPVVWFVWTVRESALVDHFMPKLQAAQRAGFTVRIYQTGAAAAPDQESGDRAPAMCVGRPRMSRVVAAMAAEMRRKKIDRCAALGCGPKLLLQSLKAAVAAPQQAGDGNGEPCVFELHEETFEY